MKHGENDAKKKKSSVSSVINTLHKEVYNNYGSENRDGSVAVSRLVVCSILIPSTDNKQLGDNDKS